MSKSTKTIKPKRTEGEASSTPPRTDGRKAFFTYMKPDLITQMKAAAADDGLRAWQFIERAVARALKSRPKP